MKTKSLLLLAATLGLAAPASAQRLYFDGDASLEWSDVTLSGSNLQRTIKGPGGADTTQSIPTSKVTRVDWPYPAELNDALALILQQKYDAALAKASAVRTIHANWKDKPGSWYVQASLYVAECLIHKKDAAELDKALTELRTMTLPSSQQKGLLMVQALADLEKNATTPALEKAQRAAQGLEDDSALAARLAVLIGDIKFKSDQFSDALDSYLQVPVFYGAQGQLMPSAELGAARCLFQLGRLADASKSFGYIATRYKGTPEAAAATKEKIEVDTVLTGGSTDKAKDKDKDKDAEKPKEEQK